MGMRVAAFGLAAVSLAACEQTGGGVGFDGAVPAGGGTKPVQQTTVYETGTPSGVPLSPEEQALYDSLTPQQKARADAFLRDGSTVASSLLGDP